MRITPNQKQTYTHTKQTNKTYRKPTQKTNTPSTTPNKYIVYKKRRPPPAEPPSVNFKRRLSYKE